MWTDANRHSITTMKFLASLRQVIDRAGWGKPKFSSALKELPFFFGTPLRTYLFDAYPTGILWPVPSFEEELCTYVINFSFPLSKEGANANRHVRNEPFLGWTHWKATQFLEIDDHLAAVKGVAPQELGNHLGGCLEEGKYVTCRLDKFYIPGSPQYRQTHLSHQILLIGYDRQKHLFSCVDYLEKGGFGRFALPASCVAEGIASDAVTPIMVRVIRINRAMPRRGISLPVLRGQILDYLNARRSAPAYAQNYVPEFTDVVYGRAAYGRMAQYLSSCVESKKAIDLRTTRLMLERQRVMKLRLSLLDQSRDLARTSVVSSLQERCEQNANLLHMLAMGYTQHQPANLERMLAAVRGLATAEADLYTELLQRLP